MKTRVSLKFFVNHCSWFEKDKKVEDNIIKDVRNLFRLKKEIDDSTIKDIIEAQLKHKKSV